MMLDSYLDQLQENKKENLKEDFLVAFMALNLMFFIQLLGALLTVWSEFYKRSKVDTYYTNLIKNITRSTQWTVRRWFPSKYVSKDPVYNAFSVSTKTIFITDDLPKLLNEKEITAVLLHEISHSISKDSIRVLFLNYFGRLGPFLITLALGLPFLASVGPFFIFLLVSVYLQAAYIRTRELKADSYAAKYGYKEELSSALIKLMKEAKKQPSCTTKFCKFIDVLKRGFKTHPDLEERLENIMNTPEIQRLISRGPNGIKQLMTRVDKIVRSKR